MCVHMYTHTHIYILFISVRILVSKDICKLLDLNFGTNLELICLWMFRQYEKSTLGPLVAKKKKKSYPEGKVNGKVMAGKGHKYKEVSLPSWRAASTLPFVDAAFHGHTHTACNARERAAPEQPLQLPPYPKRGAASASSASPRPPTASRLEWAGCARGVLTATSTPLWHFFPGLDSTARSPEARGLLAFVEMPAGSPLTAAPASPLRPKRAATLALRLHLFKPRWPVASKLVGPGLLFLLWILKCL